MSKNLIPQIAQMLGVEIGEKFKIKGYNEPIYRFDADGLKASFDNFSKKEEGLANASLGSLLAGNLEIIKLPWKPNVGGRILYIQHFHWEVDCLSTALD